MPGNYAACLISENTCGIDTLCQALDVIVGLTDAAVSKVDIKVWPNPTQEQLFIRAMANGEGIKEYTFEILDQHSRVVLTKRNIRDQSTYVLAIDFLPAGMYYYRVKKDGIPYYFDKLIKL